MTLEYYRGMLIQTTRMEAFQRHLRNIVRPGDHVLEIGAGLGTYSFFAADAGAASVCGVEGSPIVGVAKTIARVNGYADRVEFVRGWFPHVEVSGPVDVLIFEDYPPRLLDAATHAMLKRLHEDVLTPGARVVPNRARMYLAPVFSAQSWKVVGRFGDEEDVAYGIDWYPSREYIYNTPLHMPVTSDDLEHEPRRIADVRLDRLLNAGELAGQAEWTFARDAAVNGLAYWFDFEVGEGTWLTNAPGRDPGSWGNLYLPTPEVLTIAAGETLHARVTPEVADSGAPGWLTWEVRHADTSFTGHEFKAFPAALTDVIPSSPSWIPELSHEGEVERQILELADGTRSVGEIARVVQGTIPALSVDEVTTLVMSTLSGRTKPNPKVVRS